MGVKELLQYLHSEQKGLEKVDLKKSLPIKGERITIPGLISFYLGTGGRINVGFDLWMKSVNLTSQSGFNRTAVTGFGPKIKLAPIRSLDRFSYQMTLLFPCSR